MEDLRFHRWYLRAFARPLWENKANVILCSPIPHMKFERDGKFVEDWKKWRSWVEACAKSERAAFLDLSDRIGRAYEALERASIESDFAEKWAACEHSRHTFQ